MFNKACVKVNNKVLQFYGIDEKQVNASIEKLENRTEQQSKQPRLNLLTKSSSTPPRDKSTSCFHCQQEGHWMKDCPQKKRESY